MKLSKNETYSVVAMGLGGFAVASLYQLFNVYMKQCSDQTLDDIHTEHLNEHSLLYTLFVQLADYREYNELAFRRAVVDADRILGQIGKPKTEHERAMTYVHSKNFEVHLRLLIKSVIPPRDKEQAKDIAKDLHETMYDVLKHLH